jgi:DNA (cytosine-5)-methyltransferase 1
VSGLVLSLFPGIGLLDMAFEEEGFTVVRGPDLLWGGDIRKFHPPSGRFDGVIGGPPCQTHSSLSRLSMIGNGVPGGHRHGDQIPEFCRVVGEARPDWFIMENVTAAPVPEVGGYGIRACVVNNRWFGEEQNRARRFSFGCRNDLETPARFHYYMHAQDRLLEAVNWEPAVLAGHGPAAGQRVRGIQGRTWQEAARLQGLDEERIAQLAEDAPFHVHGFKKVIGNGVPLPMGRAVARAVKRALGMDKAA